MVLIWTPKAIYFFCNTFLADIANQNILLQINNVLMYMEYHSSALWKMAILNLRKYWEQNCQCCKSMKWNKVDAMIWMIQAMWDYIVGLFPVLPILMQNIELLHFQIWWKKPLTGAFGIWQCRIISSGAKEKYSLMDF